MNTQTATPATQVKVNFNDKIALGKVDGRTIYLSAPKWDCGWYWGFGYLGNKDCHYHVDGLKKIETYNTEKQCWEYEFVNLFDGFKKHFDKDTFIVTKDSYLWTLCELFSTFYTLKETAEVLGRGGAHYTSNPCQSIIMNKDEANRINTIVIPSILNEIYRILKECSVLPEKYNEIKKLINKGDTIKVVNFMFEYGIHTDDLKNIQGITSHDINIVHTYYWAEFYKTNK